MYLWLSISDVKGKTKVTKHDGRCQFFFFFFQRSEVAKYAEHLQEAVFDE